MSTATLTKTGTPAKGTTGKHAPKNPKTMPARLYHGMRMSWKRFQDWQAPEFDGWKYEWSNGFLRAYELKMKTEERYIVLNIIRHFVATKYFQMGGMLFPEALFKLPGKNRGRIPDLAFSSKEQNQMGRITPEVVPAFAIELISPHDIVYELERKIEDYFDAGVQCVWLIYPELNYVKVYASRNLSQTFRMGDNCSAAPALLEFSMPVEAIFA